MRSEGSWLQDLSNGFRFVFVFRAFRLWRQHEKQCAQQFVSCLVENCRNMHVGRANDASSAFKDLELSQQAKRPFTEKSADSKATSRAEQERAKRRVCHEPLWAHRREVLRCR